MGKGKGPGRKSRSASRSHKAMRRLNNRRMNEGQSGPVRIIKMTDEDYPKHGFKERSYYQGDDTTTRSDSE